MFTLTLPFGFKCDYYLNPLFLLFFSSSNHGSLFLNSKVKKGRPMKRSKNVRKMKAVSKAISKSEQYNEKTSKHESKKSRMQSAKTLYD
jgi:hypothetical protein